MPITFVKGNYFGTPLYTMCQINKGDDKRQGLRTGGLAGGGGGGRYEAQRVKGGIHVITCNLTASASHLLVSAVPRIRITVSKSPFLIRVEKCMNCHTISPGSYISWHKGAAHPLPSHCLLTPLLPPPHISPLRVILCIISLWPHFPCFSNSLFVPVSQRGRGFLAAM
jgi:hypothetical protein